MLILFTAVVFFAKDDHIQFARIALFVSSRDDKSNGRGSSRKPVPEAGAIVRGEVGQTA